MDLLAAPATPPTRGFYDECMKADGIQFSLGFMKSTPTWPFGSARSFGSPGSGGSLGYADPEVAVGYAYVTSQSGTALTGDPRDVALRAAHYSCLRKQCRSGASFASARTRQSPEPGALISPSKRRTNDPATPSGVFSST